MNKIIHIHPITQCVFGPNSKESKAFSVVKQVLIHMIVELQVLIMKKINDCRDREGRKYHLPNINIIFPLIQDLD